MVWNWNPFTWDSRSWWTWFLGGIAALFVAFFAFGCAQPAPIEQFAGKFVDNVIEPAVKEGLSRGVESLTIQAGAQGINPTYVVKFAGKWVVGIEGEASVGVQGLSGQMAITSLSPVRTELPGGVVRMPPPSAVSSPTPGGGTVAPPHAIDDTVLHLPPPGEDGRPPAAEPISLSAPGSRTSRSVQTPARRNFNIVNGRRAL